MNHGYQDDRPTDHRAAISARNLENLAYLVYQTKDHIEREYRISDGAVAAASYDGTTHGAMTIRVEDENGELDAVPVTGVERTVIARAVLAEKMMEINDDLDTIEKIIKSCEKTCRKALGTRVPIEGNRKPRCWAGDLDGYDLAMSDGGWSDPTCERIPRRGDSGPCDACYMRHIRYRTRVGLPPLRSINPAA